MKKILLFSGILSLAMLTSCSSLRIEKRHYRNGYYVSLNNNNERPAQTTSVENESPETPAVTTAEAEAVVVNPVVPVAETAAPTVAPVQQKEENNSSPATEPTEVPQVQNDSAPETVAQPAEENTGTPHDDVALVLLVILAILLPPLAVYLAQGLTKWFWITLILCLFGGGFIFYPVFGGLWLVSIIIALFVVFGLL